MWQHNYEPIGGSLGVSALVAAIAVDALGNVIPCVFLPVSFGNIMTEDLPAILGLAAAVRVLEELQHPRAAEPEKMLLDRVCEDGGTVYEPCYDDLPAAAACIFPQLRQLHFGILTVQSAYPGVESHPENRVIGSLRETRIVATVLSSHCCLLRRRLWSGLSKC